MTNGGQNKQLLDAVRIKDKDISKTIPVLLLSHWPSILGIVAIIILLSIDSGKDLLVGLLDTDQPEQIFYRTGMIFLALILYSSSIWLRPFIMYRRRHRESWFHRTLAILPCVVLGAAILNTQFKLDLLTAPSIYWGLFLLLLIFMGSIYYRKYLYNYINLWQSFFIFFITIAALTAAIYINKSAGLEDVILSYHLFGIAIAVLGVGLFHLYKKIDLDLSKQGGNIHKSSKDLYMVFFYVITFLIGIFVSIFSFFDHIHLFHPIFVFLCSFAFYTVMFNLLSSFYDINSYRKTLIKNILFLVVVFTVAFGFAFPNYEHHKVDLVESSLGAERISLDQHMEAWLNLKARPFLQKHPNENFPVWLIAGEGGGSRAGYWFTRSMLAIDSINNYHFKDQVYAMSTVSGSSVGGAALLAFWDRFSNRDKEQKDTVSSQLAERVFKNNYLSSAIFSILIRDFIKQLFPFRPLVGQEDRNYWLQQEEAFFIEKALQNKSLKARDYLKEPQLPSKKSGAYALYEPFLGYYYDSTGQFNYDLPLFIPNATVVQRGKRALVSPVKFRDFQFIDAMDINQFILDHYDAQALSLGEACNLSELFPFFSATAVLGDSIAIGDGGYFENLGLTTLYEIKDEMESVLRRPGFRDIRDRVDIQMLVIRNSTYKEKMKRQLKVRNQIYAPLDALYNSGIGGRTEYMFKYMKMKMQDNFHVLDLPHESGQNEKLLLPLNRYLSENAIHTMDELFREQNLNAFQLPTVLDSKR